MPNQPESAFIPIKAHTAIGNVLVIKAQQANDLDLFRQAIEHYEYVTNAYEKSQDIYLRSYGSIAYFGLGAAYERQGESTKAIRAYEAAYDLADDQEFKSRIEQQIRVLQGQ